MAVNYRWYMYHKNSVYGITKEDETGVDAVSLVTMKPARFSHSTLDKMKEQGRIEITTNPAIATLQALRINKR